MSFYLDVGDITDAQRVKEPIQYLCAELQRSGSIRLVKEFSEGYTETRVFLATEQKTPEDLQP